MKPALTDGIKPEATAGNGEHQSTIVDEAKRLSQMTDSLFDAVRRMTHRRPRATYRVQFNRDFTFRQAAELVPYWDSLGISDVYASPYLKAVPGSMHGYDIVDHSVLNPELGTIEDFRAFTSALDAHGMGHILDFVPNHMGVGADENHWWSDVLENGPGSLYASYFDIDWDPLKPDLLYKVLLPVLGEQFGQVLENGQLRLAFEDGAFFIHCYQRRFPIAPKSFATILNHRQDELARRMSSEDPNYLEFQSVLTSLSFLPPRTETDPLKLEVRRREKEVVKRRLNRLCEECRPILDWIQENVEIFNGTVGEPRSFDLLDGLLEEQCYRLSFWRVAADEINYRRFFDVNELAALCMERPEVFESTHRFIFELLDEGLIDGLRIDHADGLYDPTSYLWQLQERRFLQLCRQEFIKGGNDRDEWPEVESALQERFASVRKESVADPAFCPLYVLVEKILEHGESLPEQWPIAGSTGYEFLKDVNGLFVDGNNARSLDSAYAKFLGEKVNFHQLVYEAKRLILRSAMSSELHVLGHYLDRISENDRWTRDFTLHGLILTLREVISCFPVYRTYTVDQDVTEQDRRCILQAVVRARRRNPEISGAIFDFVRDVLLLEDVASLQESERERRLSFVGRFQQFTGPVMAKAVEDTTYYRYHRLISLNEVGAGPEHFGTGLLEWHLHNVERQKRRPFGMLATSTHDTKRAEDVRARINALSEMPEEWKRRVTQWTRLTRKARTEVDGEFAPCRNDEYLLYQTLVGSWPFQPPHGEALAEYVSRIQQYMTKAIREAKQYSSWIAPNETYESALHRFIETILADNPKHAFRVDLEELTQRATTRGMWNSLGQNLLKLTSPGIPDLYQGTEFWDLSLVDPDNRRPVDYEARRQALAELQARLQGESAERLSFAKELVEQAEDGRIKLAVQHLALEMRRRLPELFTTGDYLPLSVEGALADCVCAFVRRSENAACLVVVPRLMGRLPSLGASPPIGAEAWPETSVILPPELTGVSWKNAVTKEQVEADRSGRLPVGVLLSTFPVGLFEAAVQNSSGDPQVVP